MADLRDSDICALCISGRLSSNTARVSSNVMLSALAPSETLPRYMVFTPRKESVFRMQMSSVHSANS